MQGRSQVVHVLPEPVHFGGFCEEPCWAWYTNLSNSKYQLIWILFSICPHCYFPLQPTICLLLFYFLQPSVLKLVCTASLCPRWTEPEDEGSITLWSDSWRSVWWTQSLTQQTKGNNSARQTRNTTTKTWIAYGNSTWRASKYKVYKLHQRYILKKGCPQWYVYPPFQAHSATQVCTGIQQKQFLFAKSYCYFRKYTRTADEVVDENMI